MFDRRLAARLEAADGAGALEHAQTRARLEPESNCRWETIGEGTAVYSGHASPVRGVTGLGMTRPVTAEEVRAAVAFFGGLGLPAPIHLCPLADASLTAALTPFRQSVQSFKHVWVRDAQATGDLPPAPPVRVEEATDAAARRLWAQVVEAGFHGDDVLEDADREVSGVGARRPSVRCFLAYVDGRPAGGGALSLRNGLGVCFSASTRPRFRRCGVQAALLHARLAAARAAGCDLAMVHTVPGSDSQRNVERFGFRIAYTRVTITAALYADERGKDG